MSVQNRLRLREPDPQVPLLCPYLGKMTYIPSAKQLASLAQDEVARLRPKSAAHSQMVNAPSHSHC
jgi:hypothetical protein